MAVPFLGDGSPEQRERYNQIADEAEAYFAALAGEPIPGQEDADSEIPEPVLWLLRTERLGHPYAGGYMDQPYHFMQDIEWARTGRARLAVIQAANKALQQRPKE